MGRFLIKTDPDEDLYMEWSTGVDAPIFFGTREELVTWLCKPKKEHQRTVIDDLEYVEERVQRTDETGSSMMSWDEGWDSSGLMVYRCNEVEWEGKGRRWLPRSKYTEYARRRLTGLEEGIEYVDVSDILEEITDDDNPAYS